MNEGDGPERSSDEATSGSESWVLSPVLSQGTTLELRTLTNAEVLTPEVLERLKELMAQLQEAEVEPRADKGCPGFTDCGTYKGDCDSLKSCTSYKLK
jgi:hypothetical protein